MSHLLMTEDTLRAAYDLLNTQRPFSSWNLPDSDDVSFRVTRNRRLMGRCVWWSDGGATIEISRNCVGHVDTLMRVMAHEMVHLHHYRNKLDSSGVQHNAAFNRDLAATAKSLGFDPKSL